MHSIYWFWTTGIHDAAWVQAFAAIALVALTLVTLIVLYFYARDTHTLAKTSVEQINFMKTQWANDLSQKAHAAFVGVLNAHRSLTELVKAIKDGSFRTKPRLLVYPDNWTEVTSALSQRDSRFKTPCLKLGTRLREVDLAVGAVLTASNDDEIDECGRKLGNALEDAAGECKVVFDLFKQVVKD